MKAVFFDKDGVINVDNGIKGILLEPQIYNGIADIISNLRKNKFKIFIVTNQACVARGIITEIKLKQKLKEFQLKLLKLNENSIIDKIYYCPHHENADIKEYRINCNCRKPKSGMLLKAKCEFEIDLKKSYIIGDRITDIIAGFNVNCRTILFKSGKHNNKIIETSFKINEKIKPDHIIDNIYQLEGIIK